MAVRSTADGRLFTLIVGTVLTYLAGCRRRTIVLRV